MTKPTVHIVHHVDTEGPMREPLDELFERIENTIGHPLNLSPTKENLQLLQSSEFVFINSEIDQLLKKLIDPKLLSFKNTWNEVDEMLDRILTAEYRNKFKDSYGNGWIYNWHLLDHVGFDTNPRYRILGYSGIFDLYKTKLKKLNITQDSLQWHFHPIPFNKAAHTSAISYMNSAYELQQVMCRRLIDSNWFPVVNRAGFHTVRPDSNWWLEQWLPFDASNQAMANDNTGFNDNINGRFGDWRGAPDDWSLYHPDLYDWRKRGNMRRTISRCLNMNTRFRNIDTVELSRAFQLAEKTGRDVYVGITNHDFREMSVEMEAFYEILKDVAAENTNVNFAFSNTIHAFQKSSGFSEVEILNSKIDLKVELINDTLKVEVINGEIFGPQPFIGLLTKDGRYLTDNFNFGETGSKTYYYTFDFLTLPIENLKTIAVASNDKYGNTCIRKIDL
ncbi:MAG: hypothetical protein PSX81_15465 [bacterium]|nr:hypothetical protein [bacterium]